MENIAVKVIKKITQAKDIVSFELASADGTPLAPFSAGSHIDVHIPGGLTRQYSLCNDAAEQHRYRIAVLRDDASRGGSIAMHDQVNVGDVLHISLPKNHFPLQHAARTLLFAGGIGVTPLLCMAQRLAAIGADFNLHYCTRSIDRTAFQQEISDSVFADRVQFHYDDGPTDQKLNLQAALGDPQTERQLYVCGPVGFIDYVVATAKNLGWNSEQIHVEYFGAAVQDASGDVGFEIKIASTGQTYRVGADENIVQVLKSHGIEILTSCEQGVCGTCITRVLEGQPDHRDMYFTDEERIKNDQFTPCCSRSISKTLVLDL